MIRLALPVALVLLGACGVEGPPVPPSRADPEERQPGLVISGSAAIGVSGASGG